MYKAVTMLFNHYNTKCVFIKKRVVEEKIPTYYKISFMFHGKPLPATARTY
jgi:hypothetical protein